MCTSCFAQVHDELQAYYYKEKKEKNWPVDKFPLYLTSIIYNNGLQYNNNNNNNSQCDPAYAESGKIWKRPIPSDPQKFWENIL